MATHGIDPQARGLANRLVLSILAALVPAANKIIYFTSASAAALTDLVSQARSFLANPDSQYVNFLQAGTGATTRTLRDKSRDVVSAQDFGVVADGSTNDYAALQACIDALETLGGGTILWRGGTTVRVNTAPVLKNGVSLDLNGGTLALYLTGDGGYNYGLSFRGENVVQNGTVTVTSSGSVGSQSGIHSPVNLGRFYGDSGSKASPSAGAVISNIVLRNLTLSTDRDGKVAVSILGDVSNVLIENITIPASSTLGGAVHIDWGAYSGISSAAADMAANRTAFNAGTTCTTHPHNITVRNIVGGAQTRTNSGADTGFVAVRLSGVYNVNVDNVDFAETTYAAFRFHAGDLGFEFALAAQKPLAHTGIVVRGVSSRDCNNGNGMLIDCYADNVAAAVSGYAYSPLLDPTAYTDLVVEQCSLFSDAGASVVDGARLTNMRGGVIRNNRICGFRLGVAVDTGVYETLIEENTVHGNREHGISVAHATTPPDGITVARNMCYQNGQDTGFTTPSGVQIGKAYNIIVTGNKLGHITAASETTQKYGVWVQSNEAANIIITDNYVYSVKSGNIAYTVLSSTDYGVVSLFLNNTCASGVTTYYAGVNIVPVAITLDGSGAFRKSFRCERASLSGDTTPSAGTWGTGDIITYNAPAASGFMGSVCTSGGSPGTWKTWGAVSA